MSAATVVPVPVKPPEIVSESVSIATVASGSNAPFESASASKSMGRARRPPPGCAFDHVGERAEIGDRDRPSFVGNLIGDHVSTGSALSTTRSSNARSRAPSRGAIAQCGPIACVRSRETTFEFASAEPVDRKCQKDLRAMRFSPFSSELLHCDACFTGPSVDVVPIAGRNADTGPTDLSPTHCLYRPA